MLHLETNALADLYLAGKNLLAPRGLDGKRSITLSGLTLPLTPPAYVILHKLRFRQQGASERHLRDIRPKLRALGDSFDVVQLLADAGALGLEIPWDVMGRLTE